METKLFVATKAFITNNNKVLVVREASQYDVGTNPGKYDVVGGRIEPNEHFLDALIREVKEEVGLEIIVGKPFAVGEWFPKVKDEQWHVIAVYFECQTMNTDVILSQDHDDHQWIDPAEASAFPLMENLRPIFAAFVNQ